MKRVVISGSGLFTAPNIISNEELVASYNSYVSQFNTENASRIAAGEIERLEASSVEFIEKASGIKRRSVMEKSGVLDPQRMRPKLERRPDSELSIQAEMAVAAARDALVSAGKTGADIDLRDLRCIDYAESFPGNGHRSAERVGNYSRCGLRYECGVFICDLCPGYGG